MTWQLWPHLSLAVDRAPPLDCSVALSALTTWHLQPSINASDVEPEGTARGGGASAAWVRWKLDMLEHVGTHMCCQVCDGQNAEVRAAMFS